MQDMQHDFTIQISHHLLIPRQHVSVSVDIGLILVGIDIGNYVVGNQGISDITITDIGT